jgi:polyisoprenoid-binding protein YceI
VELTGSPATCRVDATVAAHLRTSNMTRDAHVASAAFLDSAKFPEIRFVAHSIRPTAEFAWVCDGQLTVRGIAHPQRWAVSVHPSSTEDVLSASVSGTVSRGDFGVSAYRWLVGDRVEVFVEFEAERVPASPGAGTHRRRSAP